MKKIILSIVLLATLAPTEASAQQVYLEIREKAQQLADDPNSASTVKEINRFKVDALNYLAMKMKEEMPDSSATYLDRQAYALHLFLGLYMKTMLSHRADPQKIQVGYIKLFMDASYSNPLFQDNDKDLVLAYFSDGESLTRFSLDTDWLKAHLAATTELKKRPSR